MLLSAKRIKFSLMLFVLLALASCNYSLNTLPDKIDLFSFSYLGNTLLSDPEHLSIKEIHLENTILLGKDVIVKGSIVELGGFSTYVVLANETARMLIVLTDLSDSYYLSNELDSKEVLVFGAVSSGKKGLPFIQAKAIKVL